MGDVFQDGTITKIFNAKTNGSVDLDTGSNRKIQCWDYHGGPNQNWILNRTQEGWTLKNVHTNTYLGFEGNPGNGTRIVAVGNAFSWNVWPDKQDGSVHRLFAPNTNLNLDLEDFGNRGNGNEIQLWEQTDGRHQCWRFERA